MNFKKYKERVEDVISDYPIIRLLAFLCALSLVLSVVVSVSVYRPYKTYKLGEFADRNIKAPQSVEFEDKESTEKEIKESEKFIAPVYDYDPGLFNTEKQRLHDAFRTLRKNPSDPYGRKIFEGYISRPVEDSVYKLLSSDKFSWRLEKAILYVLNAIPDRYIIDNKESFMEEGSEEIVIQDVSRSQYDPSSLGSSRRLKVVQIIDRIISVNDVYDSMEKKFSEISSKFTGPEKNAVMWISGSLLQANLTFNKDKTVRERATVSNRVEKVIIRVNRGEIIIRDGDPIERKQLLILEQLRKANEGFNTLILYVFHFFLVFFAFYSIVLYARAFLIQKPKQKDLIVVGIYSVIFAVTLKAWAFVATMLSNNFGNVPVEVFLLFFPFISVALVLRIIITPEFAALSSVAIGVITGIVLDGNYMIGIYVMLSSFVAIVFIMKFEERSTLLKAGFYAGVFQLIFATVVMLSKVYTIHFEWYHLVYAAGAGFISAILSAFVAEAFIPIFEYVFGYTTNIKLLEYANTNHPLLRELLIKASGTYNHSMIVGQLAAAGADAIGANSLLARVGSYYHDIGKMGKAMYFIENQQGGANPHEKLNPTMSARILVSHVKDGVRLAKEYKLGKPIIDIVEQHHGTSMMKFFYAKAKEINKEVDEMDYRYPGPKPRSREAVLVMIADACEAACRTIEEPSPAGIKHSVDTIVNNIFADGQFDESNITLKRLKIISNVYTKILIALHHNRIEYPDTPSAEERNVGDYIDRRRWDKYTQKVVDGSDDRNAPDGRL